MYSHVVIEAPRGFGAFGGSAPVVKGFPSYLPYDQAYASEESDG
jgi:hypothetical protein